MKCTDCIMYSKLLCLLMCVIGSQLNKASPFKTLWGGSVSLDFIFQKMLGSKEKITSYSLLLKVLSFYSNIQNYQSTNLQNYTTDPSQMTQILLEKGASLCQNS